MKIEKTEITNTNINKIERILRESQNRWSGLKIGAWFIYQKVKDIEKLISLMNLSVSDYNGAKIQYNASYTKYSKSGTQGTCFKMIIENGRFFLIDIYCDQLTFSNYSLELCIDENWDFFLADKAILSDKSGNLINVALKDILSIRIVDFGIQLDYRVTDFVTLKKTIHSIFKDKEQEELDDMTKNAWDYFKRNFPNRVRKMKLDRYLGGAA